MFHVSSLTVVVCYCYFLLFATMATGYLRSLYDAFIHLIILYPVNVTLMYRFKVKEEEETPVAVVLLMNLYSLRALWAIQR